MTSSETRFPLRTLTLEITNFCLLNCMHCSSEASRTRCDKLPFDVIKTALDDLKTLGGKEVELSGGEPLCHDHLLEIIEYAKKLELETLLYSSGFSKPIQLTKSGYGLQETVRQLRDSGVDKVFVSLHGSNEEYHDQVSRKHSFRHTAQFIRMLVKEGIFVGVHFVPVNLNFDSIDDLRQLCLDWGVKELGILRFVPQGRGKKNEDVLKLSAEQTLQLASLLNEYVGKKDIIRVGSHLDFCFFFDEQHTPTPCKAGIEKCLITPQGHVLPCPVFKGLEHFAAGNVKETRLRDIWIKPDTFRHLRKFDPTKLRGPCRSCEFLQKCRGRCPAQRYYQWKDLYKGPDPYCPREAWERARSDKSIK